MEAVARGFAEPWLHLGRVFARAHGATARYSKLNENVATHNTAEPASSAGDEHRVGLLVAVSVDSVGDSHVGNFLGIWMREEGCK
jgi:hypothetical protein